MVTKQLLHIMEVYHCFVLAKKLMVTKLCKRKKIQEVGFVLAKKLMVTKH